MIRGGILSPGVGEIDLGKEDIYILLCRYLCYLIFL